MINLNFIFTSDASILNMKKIIEKFSVTINQKILISVPKYTERVGLDFNEICKALNKLLLQLIFHDCKDLKSLNNLLLLYYLD